MHWKEDYKIGIESIDEQHKRLFELLQFVQKSLKKGLVTWETGVAIKELVEYTKYHFSCEEEVMEQYNYSLLDAHRKEHRRLICELKRLLLDLKRGKTVTSMDLIKILTHWIVNHILDEDLKLRGLETASVTSS